MSGNRVQPFRVSVLLHQDGEAWVAQCLEYDLAAQAPSEEEAKKRFVRTLQAQIMDDLRDGLTPLSKLPKAPRRYFVDSVTYNKDGPELPVWAPAEKKLDGTLQFFSLAA